MKKKIVVVLVIGVILILVGVILVFKPFDKKEVTSYTPFEIAQFQSRALEVVSYLYEEEGTFFEVKGTISNDQVTIVQKMSDSKEVVRTYFFHVKTESIDIESISSSFQIGFIA